MAYTNKSSALLFIATYLLCVILQAFVIHRFQIDWLRAIKDACLWNAVLALAALSTVQLFRFYQPGVGSGIYRFVLVLGIAVLTGMTGRWCLHQLFVGDLSYLSFIDSSMAIRYVFALLLLAFVTVLNWMWNNVAEKSKQTLHQSEVEQLHKEAELIKLRQQLQPHFLFNSLNSISALAGTNPVLARKMTQQLSDFLRGTLRKDEQQTVTLGEELNQLALYLDIEKIRFGERLQVTIDCADNCRDQKIPPLLLQPIVENAIKFGLYGTLEGVQINIKAFMQQNYLMVIVTNPFDEHFGESSTGTGFGLRFIQRRLFLLYAQNNLLYTSNQNNIYTTQISIPQ